MTTHYHKGWDAFQPDPSTEKEMFCRVCGTKLDVIRDVLGPRSSIGAMFGHKSRHDSFCCPNAGDKWHDQALALLEMAYKTPSKVFEEMLLKEAEAIIQSREATKTDYSMFH